MSNQHRPESMRDGQTEAVLGAVSRVECGFLYETGHLLQTQNINIRLRLIRFQ